MSYRDCKINMKFKLWIESQENQMFWVSRKSDMVKSGFLVKPVDKSKWRQTKIAVENMFEKIRQKINPNAPSRLSCIFLYPSLEACSIQGMDSKIYAVKVTGGKRFLADADVFADCFYRSIIDGEDDESIYNNGKECAIHYWQGTSINSPEVLVDGVVEVMFPV